MWRSEIDLKKLQHCSALFYNWLVIKVVFISYDENFCFPLDILSTFDEIGTTRITSTIVTDGIITWMSINSTFEISTRMATRIWRCIQLFNNLVVTFILKSAHLKKKLRQDNHQIKYNSNYQFECDILNKWLNCSCLLRHSMSVRRRMKIPFNACFSTNHTIFTIYRSKINAIRFIIIAPHSKILWLICRQMLMFFLCILRRLHRKHMQNWLARCRYKYLNDFLIYSV